MITIVMAFMQQHGWNVFEHISGELLCFLALMSNYRSTHSALTLGIC